MPPSLVKTGMSSHSPRRYRPRNIDPHPATETTVRAWHWLMPARFFALALRALGDDAVAHLEGGPARDALLHGLADHQRISLRRPQATQRMMSTPSRTATNSEGAQPSQCRRLCNHRRITSPLPQVAPDAPYNNSQRLLGFAPEVSSCGPESA